MLSFILDEPRWQGEQNTVVFYDGISNKSMLWNWQVIDKFLYEKLQIDKKRYEKLEHYNR